MKTKSLGLALTVRIVPAVEAKARRGLLKKEGKVHFNSSPQGWKLNFDSTGHLASVFYKCNKKSRICTHPRGFDTRLGEWASANFQPCCQWMSVGEVPKTQWEAASKRGR